MTATESDRSISVYSAQMACAEGQGLLLSLLLSCDLHDTCHSPRLIENTAKPARIRIV